MTLVYILGVLQAALLMAFFGYLGLFISLPISYILVSNYPKVEAWLNARDHNNDTN